MKVGFVYNDFSKGAKGKFYHGIAYLSSWLKKFNHTTVLLHLTAPIEKKYFISWLEREKLDLLAFSATTNAYPYVAEIARWAKESADIPTIIGGVHATLVPEEVINNGSFDFVCVGEGEEPLLELCQALEKNEDASCIKNIWVKTSSGGLIRNNPRPWLKDLDHLPFPDREFMNYENSYDLLEMKRGVFMASRGCPFQCSYCCNPAIKKIYQDDKISYVRFRSVDNVISEIEEVLKKYPPINNIAFHDDCLSLKKQWIRQFLNTYKNKIALPFIMNTHVELAEEEILKMAKEAGLTTLYIGLESGNEFIRNNLLNRRMSNKKIISTYKMIHRLGIETYSYNIVGFPGESFKNMLETVKLNAWVKTEKVQISVFYPYPGTQLYEAVKKENLLNGKVLDSYFEGTILNFKPFKKREIEFIFHNFEPLKIAYQAFLKLPLLRYFLFGLLDFFLTALLFFRVQNLILGAVKPVAHHFRYNRK